MTPTFLSFSDAHGGHIEIFSDSFKLGVTASKAVIIHESTLLIRFEHYSDSGYDSFETFRASVKLDMSVALPIKFNEAVVSIIAITPKRLSTNMASAV